AGGHLVFTGNSPRHSPGVNEKWLKSTNGSNAAHGGWSLLLPDGRLYAWNGSMSATAGMLVATLNPSYWTNTYQLLHAQPPVAPPVGAAAEFLGDSNVLRLSGYGRLRGS